MSIKQIAQNPSLIENLFGTAAKLGASILDNQDWFDNDGLLEKIPYGKIAVWIVQKRVEIDDVDEAFNHAYAMAYFLCFAKATTRYKVFLKGTDLVEIKGDNKLNATFPLNGAELIDADIFHYYSKKYQYLLTECKVAENTKDTIFHYIKWNLRIAFHELLEGKPVTYKKLCDGMDKKSVSLKKEKLNVTRYYLEQKNLFSSLVMGDERSMTLNDVYIEPEYRIHKDSIDERELNEHFEASDFKSPDREYVNVFVEPKKNNYNSVHDLLKDFLSYRNIKDNIKNPISRTLILLGYPGQGKTSCIRKLLYDHIDDVDNPPLIYHLPLRTIENVTNFCNAPFEVIEEHIKGKGLPADYVKELVRNGTIILEGMDELAIQSGTENKSIDEVLKELMRVQENRGVKLIITSRLGYIDCSKLKRKKQVIVQLKEFNATQQAVWLDRYKVFYPESIIEEGDIVNCNVKGHHLEELINQPILLHMVVTSEIDITKRTNRAQLYKALFDSLIERKWANENIGDNQIDILKGLEPEDLREIIQDIALAIFHSGRNCIQKDKVEKLDAVDRHIIKGLGFDNIGGALKGVMVSFYFQEVDLHSDSGSMDYGIEFLHKSLSEYMAAEKIWNEVKMFLMKEPSGRRYWKDSCEDALKTLSSLFAPNMLTVEVRDYIWEIMDNDVDFKEEELGDRFVYFLPELLQKEFVLVSSIGKVDYPIKQALHTFYGYWTILSKIAEYLHKNYLEDMQQTNLMYLIKSCLLLSPPPISLCYQKFLGEDLTGINLNKANLSGANLSGAKLAQAILDRGILVGTNFSNANLSNAELVKSRLDDAYLNGANLNRANLLGAILDGTNLTQANLSGANLSGANFTRANLSVAILEGANLSSTTLLGATLSGATLPGANLSGAILSGAILSGATLSGANLSEANLEGANLEGANFSDANLLQTNLHGAIFRNTNFFGATLSKVDLSGATLFKVNMSGANLHRTNIIGAQAINANFSGANLSEAYLLKSNLLGASFYKARLERTNLEGSNLEGADISWANLDGARFEGANFDNCTMDKENHRILTEQGVKMKGVVIREEDKPNDISE